MANINNDEDLYQAKAGTGGVLAGSGGAASGQTAQPAGSGFTNLQQYLSANQGQGAGVASQIVAEGQKGVAKDTDFANQAADTWASGVSQNVNTAATEASGRAANGQAANYGGPADAKSAQGYNEIEQNYQNVKDNANKYANDFNTQQAGLMKANNYGVGFGALDTFLGRQDGRQQLQDFRAGVNPNAAGAAGKVNSAIQAGQGQIATAEQGYRDKVAAEKAAADAARADAAARAADLPPPPKMATQERGIAPTDRPSTSVVLPPSGGIRAPDPEQSYGASRFDKKNRK